MLSDNLEHTLRNALSIARNQRHEYATYEHLLLALVEDYDAKIILKKYCVSIDLLRDQLINYLKYDLIDLIEKNVQMSKPTAGFQRIIQRAALHTQASGKRVITGIDVLAEFFFEHDSYALLCLKEANLTRQQVLEYISDNIHTYQKNKSNPNLKSEEVPLNHYNSNTNNTKKLPRTTTWRIDERGNINDIQPPKQDKEVLDDKKHENQKINIGNKYIKAQLNIDGHNANINNSAEHNIANTISQQNGELCIEEQMELAKYCVNLNDRATSDSIDCLVGREMEIKRTIEILCRRKKNNVILVGEPGVGKTAIAEGMALKIVQQDVPNFLKGATLYSLDIGNLVAGTKFRGDFEERVKILLELINKHKNAILFIDEIHTMIGTGSIATGSLDASNLLKPALSKGELRCIGSTTFKEFHNHFEKDMALVRRFQKVVISEPDIETCMQILQGLKSYYEKYHNVKYSDAALMSAITLSKRYIHDRHLPDKAIDLMDEAGAKNKTTNHGTKKITIEAKNIEALISTIINIPAIQVESNDITQLKTLSSNLKSCIFGQDTAIDNLCASVKLSKAGLRKTSRPTGCYLFSGPTGVGKTELAKQLANFCNMKLLKFDMSEFAENSSISKLLGSAPGYVGFDQGGVLTEEVTKYPYSVIVFDEIDKAHPEILNLLLQVMDEGKLTSSTGKYIDFNHTMIIITTNVMASQSKEPIGFNNQDSDEPKAESDTVNMELLHEQFSPEFRSRLDNIILFNPIDGIIDQIVSKNIRELSSQLADKKVRLKISAAATNHLTNICAQDNNGARDLDRIIDVHIKQSIADEILFGKLKNGGIASVDFNTKQEKLIFNFKSVA